jgi:hypothetical protein
MEDEWPTFRGMRKGMRVKGDKKAGVGCRKSWHWADAGGRMYKCTCGGLSFFTLVTGRMFAMAQMAPKRYGLKKTRWVHKRWRYKGIAVPPVTG